MKTNSSYFILAPQGNEANKPLAHSPDCSCIFFFLLIYPDFIKAVWNIISASCAVFPSPQTHSPQRQAVFFGNRWRPRLGRTKKNRNVTVLHAEPQSILK